MNELLKRAEAISVFCLGLMYILNVYSSYLAMGLSISFEVQFGCLIQQAPLFFINEGHSAAVSFV